jgi:proteasome accessory factor B
VNKSERLLNLLILLLVQRHYISKERIRATVDAYRDSSDEAFERMFERDKEELRDMGIPLETGCHDPLFSDEVGYRIDRAAYALPEVEFSPDEMAVLGLAARAWQQATLSQAAGTALLKLRSAGVDPDESAIVGLEPRVKATEPAFAPLWEAVREARPVKFPYRGPRETEPAQRRLEPWGILSRNGRWYVVGHDRDRGAPRVFRLSRVAGAVRPDGPDGSVVVPPGTDIRDQLTRMLPPEPKRSALLAVRSGAGLGLRYRASATEADPAGGPGWDRVELGYRDEESLAEELVSYGPVVRALEPPELCDAVVRRLEAMLATSEYASTP